MAVAPVPAPAPARSRTAQGDRCPALRDRRRHAGRRIAGRDAEEAVEPVGDAGPPVLAGEGGERPAPLDPRLERLDRPRGRVAYGRAVQDDQVEGIVREGMEGEVPGRRRGNAGGARTGTFGATTFSRESSMRPRSHPGGCGPIDRTRKLENSAKGISILFARVRHALPAE